MLKVSKRIVKKADLNILEDDIQYADSTLSYIMDDITSLDNKITELESQKNEYPSEIKAAFTRFSSSVDLINERLNKINNRI